MDTILLKSLLVVHKDRFLSKQALINREILDELDQSLDSREVVFISGIRRSGKSSLMKLIAKLLIEKKQIPKANICFVNFEDERFINFTKDDFERLYQSYIELENPQGKTYFFFDEIQNISGWERWINRLYEFENVKIFITGSNASLVSSSISSSLTGRNRQLMLHPFSFKEFLRIHDIAVTERDLLSPDKTTSIKRLFGEYLNLGGFPEVIKNRDITLADQYFKDIIHRDIISFHNIRNTKELRELCLYIISNTGCLVSYESLRKMIQANNATTIKNYLSALQDVYLIHALSKYDHSVKRQIYNPDKYYISDLGFYNAIGFRFSGNLGRILENIVFEQLSRKNLEVYYWKSRSGHEVDFIIRQNVQITSAIQVTYHLTNENVERETVGLRAVCAEVGVVDRYILTYDHEQTKEDKYGEIKVVPVWKWLLDFQDNQLQAPLV